MKNPHIIFAVLIGGVGSATLFNAVSVNSTIDEAIYRSVVVNVASEKINNTFTEDTPIQQDILEKEKPTDAEDEMNHINSDLTPERNLPTQPTEIHVVANSNIDFTVPFYSQFTDITSTKWKKIGCGIASLAMLIDYYEQDLSSVDTLLQEGIDMHAYLDDVGWIYAGLIKISQKYGLTGQSYDLASATMDSAFNSLQKALTAGPVIVSVHYKLEPNNTIPHLMIANGIRDGMLYYNDPAAETGNLSIEINSFKKAWKKRYIEIRPVT